MTGKVFLDTNVLMYAGDRGSPAKREVARAIMEEHGGFAAVSTQVLQEYFVVATRKMGVAPLSAKEVVNATCARFEVITVDLGVVSRAIDGSILWQVSFWDALILAAAETAACATVLSEDLNAGQRYGSVEVRNPFG